MTTNLSEELSKLCGVPVLAPCQRCGAKRFALGQCAEVQCKACYPNFEEPENFVKLFNLQWGEDKYTTVAGYVYTVANTLPDTSGNFIKTLVEYLKCKNYFTKAQKKVKQAIKNTEWKY